MEYPILQKILINSINNKIDISSPLAPAYKSKRGKTMEVQSKRG